MTPLDDLHKIQHLFDELEEAQEGGEGEPSDEEVRELREKYGFPDIDYQASHIRMMLIGSDEDPDFHAELHPDPEGGTTVRWGKHGMFTFWDEGEPMPIRLYRTSVTGPLQIEVEQVDSGISLNLVTPDGDYVDRIAIITPRGLHLYQDLDGGDRIPFECNPSGGILLHTMPTDS